MKSLDVSIDTGSFMDASKRATGYERSLIDLATEISSLPSPIGGEEIAAAAKGIAGAMRGDAALVTGLSRWLVDRAMRAITADMGIFSSAPPLVPGRPWASPKGSSGRDPNHPGPDTASGVVSTGREMIMGLLNTAEALQSHGDDIASALGHHPTGFEAYAIEQRRRGKARTDFDAGMEHLYRNPTQLPKILWDDFTAKDARDKGDNDFAGGKILGNFGGSLLSIGKVGSTAAAASRAAKKAAAARRAADAARATASATQTEVNRAAGRVGGLGSPLTRRPNESQSHYDHREAGRLARQQAARTEMDARRVENETAIRELTDAQRAAERRALLAAAQAARLLPAVKAVPGKLAGDVVPDAKGINSALSSNFTEEGDKRRAREQAQAREKATR